MDALRLLRKIEPGENSPPQHQHQCVYPDPEMVDAIQKDFADQEARRVEGEGTRQQRSDGTHSDGQGDPQKHRPGTQRRGRAFQGSSDCVVYVGKLGSR